MRIEFYTSCGSWLDWLISTWTWGPYVHVELRFSDGVWFSSYEGAGGVRFTKDPPSGWRIGFTLDGIDERMVRCWCEQQKGGYDWLGVFRFAFPFMRPASTRWFCSEICLTALQQVGVLTHLRPHNVSPNLLYEFFLPIAV